MVVLAQISTKRRVLNRIDEWTPTGIKYKADLRHVDLILAQLNLEQANGSSMTGMRSDPAQYGDELPA